MAKSATNATGEATLAQSAVAKASHNVTEADHDRNPEDAGATNRKRNQYESTARESRTTPNPLP